MHVLYIIQHYASYILVVPLIPPPHPVGEPRTLTPRGAGLLPEWSHILRRGEQYFARMNEDIRRHDEQVVYPSFCQEMDRDRDM